MVGVFTFQQDIAPAHRAQDTAVRDVRLQIHLILSGNWCGWPVPLTLIWSTTSYGECCSDVIPAPEFEMVAIWNRRVEPIQLAHHWVSFTRQGSHFEYIHCWLTWTFCAYTGNLYFRVELFELFMSHEFCVWLQLIICTLVISMVKTI